MTRFAALALCAVLPLSAAAKDLGARAQREDFETLWRAIERSYLFVDGQREAWRQAHGAMRERAAQARTRGEFVAALEAALAELHDDHVSLSEESPHAPRRIPSETDLWPRWKGGRAVIEAVRAAGDADVAAVVPGDVVARIDGTPVEEAVRERLGESANDAARGWALRHALAGPRRGALVLELDGPRGRHGARIERREPATAGRAPLVTHRVGEARDVGYVRLRNAPADRQLLVQLDAALTQLRDTRALLLDLREWDGPDQRATTAACLARFAAAGTPWQQRAARGAKPVTDTVPNGPAPYRAPVVVLVDRWTEGEAEALAAGLREAAHARLVGTPMAGMRGDLAEVKLPHSGIRMRFPAQRALLLDGTPRERLQPALEVDLAAPSGGPGDPILYQALKLVERSGPR